MGAAPPDELGVASGVLASGRVIGQALSVAVAGAVFTSFGGAAAGAALTAGRETLSAEQARTLQQTFVTGLHAAFVVCAVVAALGVATALLRGAEGGPASMSVARTDEKQRLRASTSEEGLGLLPSVAPSNPSKAS
jgi:hypothetical protein